MESLYLTMSDAVANCQGNASILQLIGINSVVAGLEIAASVAFTFIPPLLLKTGFGEAQMTIIFGIAPLIALITVPTLGKWSDTCRSRLGRRRPFVLVLSILLILSLVLLMFAQAAVNMNDYEQLGKILMAIAVVILDYASQAAINPCESQMADLLANSSPSEVDQGYTIYSGMLSLGSCLGYLVCALDWTGSAFGTQEQSALFLVLILFNASLALTMISTEDVAAVPLEAGDGGLESPPPLLDCDDMGYASGSENDAGASRGSPEAKVRFVGEDRGALAKVARMAAQVTSFPYLLFRGILEAPLILRRLFVADLLSWMAVMAHAMFCTDFVATYIFGGRADAARGSHEDVLFDDGVRMGSWSLLLHSITACLFAAFLQRSISDSIGLRGTYVFGMTSFSCAMLVSVLFPSVAVLNVCAAVSGLGYSVITTIPNTLVTMYHAKPDVYFRGRQGRVGFGQDIAIFDSGYYLSQIVLSLFMGSLVEATGLTQLYILAASLFGFASAYLANGVVFSPDDLVLLRNHRQ